MLIVNLTRLNGDTYRATMLEIPLILPSLSYQVPGLTDGEGTPLPATKCPRTLDPRPHDEILAEQAALISDVEDGLDKAAKPSLLTALPMLGAGPKRPLRRQGNPSRSIFPTSSEIVDIHDSDSDPESHAPTHRKTIKTERQVATPSEEQHSRPGTASNSPTAMIIDDNTTPPVSAENMATGGASASALAAATAVRLQPAVFPGPTPEFVETGPLLAPPVAPSVRYTPTSLRLEPPTGMPPRAVGPEVGTGEDERAVVITPSPPPANPDDGQP